MSGPGARLVRDDGHAARLAEVIFYPSAREPGGGALNAFVQGSPMRLKVWRALLRIPEGSLVNYETLASAVGHPGAARAIGSAVAANPLACLIPCHRVIRKSGIVGEYRWGTVRKRSMIGREAASALLDPEIRGERRFTP